MEITGYRAILQAALRGGAWLLAHETYPSPLPPTSLARVPTACWRKKIVKFSKHMYTFNTHGRQVFAAVGGVLMQPSDAGHTMQQNTDRSVSHQRQKMRGLAHRCAG